MFFKILHTRQSEIILEFPRENSSNPFLNCRSCFRNVRRFNYHFGLVVEEIIELGHQKNIDVSTLSKNSYSDSGINFQRISTKLKFEPCESIRYLLSTNSFSFCTLRTSTHGHGCSKKLDTRQSKIHLISAKMIIETF